MKRKPHHTPEGRAKLVAMGKALQANPEHVAKMRAARDANSPWPARIPKLLEMAAAGESLAAMSRYFKCSKSTLQHHCAAHGIDAKAEREAKSKAGAEVLTRIYHLPISQNEKLAAYVAARGPATVDAMTQHARRLKLKGSTIRDRASTIPAMRKLLYAKLDAERAALAPSVQAVLDTGVSWVQVMAQTGISWKRLRNMVRDGLITKPQRVRVKRVRAPKPKRPAAPQARVYAIPAPVQRPAPPPAMPLPSPSSDGKVYATFWAIRAWAEARGFAYDGSNMEQLNKRRAAAGLPPLVQDEAAAA